MLRRTVSAATLTILLISMLATAFNIRLIRGFKTSEAQEPFQVDTLRFIHDETNRHEKQNSATQTRIVEHRIGILELEKLKSKIGVYEEGRDYNQMIIGHGTGLEAPTEEEWIEIANRAYIVERVLLEQANRSSYAVDHTVKPWFPPIGDQGGEGSCVAWAVGYYVKTFQEAKEHGWDLSQAEWQEGYPTTAYQDRIFSPDFIYHLINGGVDKGSDYHDAIDLICSVGACSWQKMPYDPHNSSSWPSEEAWREALLYRGNSSGYEFMKLKTDDDLTNLKNWIASEHLAVISVDANQYSNLSHEDFWTLDNYRNTSINHANTIVGYDDNIGYLEEGKWCYGAFKIVNSWGKGEWESTPDGCYWISYEAMKQQVEFCMFYRDTIDYRPELVSSFWIDHSKRGECEILIGIGNYSNPDTTKSFTDFIDGGEHPFCANSILFDITEFKEAEPEVINQSFFMEVYDDDVSTTYSGMYGWYSDGASYSWFRLGHIFDIPETGATLKFWSYHEIEEDWDYGYVEVHDLDVDEWYTLPGLMTVSTLPEHQDNPNCPSEFEPSSYYDAERWNAFTGFSSVMYKEEMDLTPFANHTIEVYFTYWTDPFVLERGWYIDDIEIPEIGFFDDVESGPHEWTYNGWYITVPEPPTTGTISSFSIEYYHSYISDSLRAKSESEDVPVNSTDQNYVLVELILRDLHPVNVTVSEARQMIESNPDLLILDVRTLEEYESEHIENAVLIPLTELAERTDELEKKKEILAYCESGERSVAACQILVDNGFSSVYNMLGGITAWRNAGYWIEIIRDGDLVVNGTQTHVIENCRYVQKGDIYVRDQAKLIIHDVAFTMNQTYNSEFQLRVEDSATLEITSSILGGTLEFSLNGVNYSKTSINNSRLDEIAVRNSGQSSITIDWCNLTEASIAENSKILIANSNLSQAITLQFVGEQIGNLEALKPGYFSYWDLHQNQTTLNVNYELTLVNTSVGSWSLDLSHDSEALVSNSTINKMWISYDETTANIYELHPGFYENLNMKNITLKNTSVGLWVFYILNSSVEMSYTEAYIIAYGNSNILISNSDIFFHGAKWFSGILFFNHSTLTVSGEIVNSHFYTQGSITQIRWFGYWVSSSLTRNYQIIASDTTGNPIDDVELILFDENYTVVWSELTDISQTANFNLTFTDSNYTDTLRLEAVKGNFSAKINVGLTSDTPVVLSMRHFADLSGDGKINIFDIFIIAKAFGSKEGDENWNPIADLDENKEINIMDLYKLARDLGKQFS